MERWILASERIRFSGAQPGEIGTKPPVSHETQISGCKPVEKPAQRRLDIPSDLPKVKRGADGVLLKFETQEQDEDITHGIATRFLHVPEC